jgi:hypothetical protein
LQSDSCKPDPAFEQLTSCTRTQTRNRGYDYSASGTLMHNDNGAIVFVKVKVAPVKISEDEIKKEIVDRLRAGMHEVAAMPEPHGASAE